MPQIRPRPVDLPYPALLTIGCLVTFACYLAVSMRLPVVPLYAGTLGITTAQIGVINSAFYLAAGLLSLPAGVAADGFGRKRLAACGLTVLGAGLLLLYVGCSYVQLTAIYLLLGAGMAAFGPTMMSWVTEISPPTHLGRAYSWYTTALFCGLGLGPAAGGALGQWLGLKPVFMVAALLVAVTLWAFGRFLPFENQPPASGSPPAPWREKVVRMTGNRPLAGCWAATFGACVVAGMFFTFLPLHAHQQGLDVRQIGIVFFVQATTNALSRIPLGSLSDRLGQRKHLVLAGALAVSLSAAAFAPARTFFHFLLAALGLGASMALAFSSIGALTSETVSAPFRGLAMGGYNSCIYLGMMAGSIGLGPVIERMGFAGGFVLTALITLPFTAIFAWFMVGFRPETNAQRRSPWQPEPMDDA